MSNFYLSEEQLRELKEAHRKLKDKQASYKINAIILLSQGYSQREVAELLLLTEKTVQRCKKFYSQKGIDGLLARRYHGSNSKLTSQQEAKLIEHLDTNLFSTSAEICLYIKETFRVCYTPSGLVHTLHRLGYSYKKTKLAPSKADGAKQKEHIEKYQKLRNNLKLNETIYYIDGVHPTHNVMRAYAWIKKGTDCYVKSNTGRKRININGAYNPIDSSIVTVQSPSINAQSTIELFKKIEEKHADLDKIYVIRDNARYYTSVLVKKYLETSKIEVIPLPSYSPNLNLIERLWKFFKKKVIYNQYYETFDEFQREVNKFFRYGVIKYRKAIKKLLTENFHIFNTS